MAHAPSVQDNHAKKQKAGCGGSAVHPKSHREPVGSCVYRFSACCVRIMLTQASASFSVFTKE